MRTAKTGPDLRPLRMVFPTMHCRSEQCLELFACSLRGKAQTQGDSNQVADLCPTRRAESKEKEKIEG